MTGGLTLQRLQLANEFMLTREEDEIKIQEGHKPAFSEGDQNSCS